MNQTDITYLAPQALDMEEAVLGALMLEKDAFFRVSGFLKADMFYKNANKLIYEAIFDLVANSQQVDILTVKNSLKKSGSLALVGGAFYLSELTARVAGSANIESHAEVIVEKHVLREVIARGNEMMQAGYDKTSDAFELLDKSEQALFNISQQSIRKGFSSMNDLVMRTLEKMEKVRSNPSSVTGMPTYFSELDKITSGLQKTDLVILAARPAMGKTALALNLARAIAKNSELGGVGFFSLEMGEIQLTQRIIVQEAEIDSQRARNGSLDDHDWKKMIQSAGLLSNSNIFIDDTPALSIHELRTKARKLKSEKGIDLVIVDYLQLMQGPGKKGSNREQEIAAISRGLKVVAKELDVCVIALSQLSRAVESRGGNKKPMLSDLRESGAIEQDADIVMFLYRPEYYGFETDEEGNSTLGKAELIISKQRNGPTGTIDLQFISKYGKFSDWTGANMPFGMPLDSRLNVPDIEGKSFYDFEEPDF